MSVWFYYTKTGREMSDGARGASQCKPGEAILYRHSWRRQGRVADGSSPRVQRHSNQWRADRSSSGWNPDRQNEDLFLADVELLLPERWCFLSSRSVRRSPRVLGDTSSWIEESGWSRARPAKDFGSLTLR